MLDAPALAGQKRFLEEFGGAGEIVSCGELQRRAAVADTWSAPAQSAVHSRRRSHITAEVWESLLPKEIALLHNERATGDDLVPAEAVKAGGEGYIRVLAGLAAAASASESGVPLVWRGGTMAAVPRKSGRPLSIVNSRGILLSPVPAKAIAKVVVANLRRSCH